LPPDTAPELTPRCGPKIGAILRAGVRTVPLAPVKGTCFHDLIDVLNQVSREEDDQISNSAKANFIHQTKRVSASARW
jgi:hypothetical protein